MLLITRPIVEWTIHGMSLLSSNDSGRIMSLSVSVIWVAANSHVDKLHGGLGGYYSQDASSRFVNERLNLNYAFHLNISEAHFLSAGITMGINRQGYDNSDFLYSGRLRTPMVFSQFTPPNIQSTDMDYNVGAGAYYRWKKLEVGLSVLNINEPTYIHDAPTSVVGPYEVKVVQARSFYGFLRHTAQLSEKTTISPMFLYSNMARFHEFAVNLLFNVHGIWRIGIGGRGYTGLTMTANTGFTIKKKWNIGYAYDQYSGAGSFGQYGGIHEFYLTFAIP